MKEKTTLLSWTLPNHFHKTVVGGELLGLKMKKTHFNKQNELIFLLLFTAVLFTITQTQNQPSCPPVGDVDKRTVAHPEEWDDFSE